MNGVKSSVSSGIPRTDKMGAPIQSPILDFYEGKTIFMTGGTGFMGKVIIEKLLTSCPGIKKIYVLIRPKKGEDMTQRLAKIKESRVFEGLKRRHPERLSKLEALAGDLLQPALGLSGAALALLQRVHVVLNVAATLNFNERLDSSVAVNVTATRTLLRMCLTMKELKSFVHVSTAYGNCDRKHIEERVYPSPVDLDQLIEELEQGASDQELEDLTKRALGKRPNTYTLTKAIAENVVEQYKTKFPIAIVRPSIVTAALRSPHPGWVDCRTGATGLLVLIGSGVLRVAYGDNSIVVDMVPVDLVSNVIVAAGWQATVSGVVDPIVYNITSGRSNPITLREMVKWTTIQSKRIPQETALWYPSVFFTTNTFLYNVGYFWMHMVPAYLHDTLVPSSEKQSLVKIHSSARKATEVLKVFMSNEYDFANGNVRKLMGQMSDHDRSEFYCDVNEVQWGPYIGEYVLGARRYLLGQKDDSLPRARERMDMYSIQNRVLKVAAALVTYFLAVNLTTPFLVGRQ